MENEITIDRIKQRLVPPLDLSPIGYMEFNINDFTMFSGFEDSGEWFYSNRFVQIHDQCTERQIVESLIMSYHLQRQWANILTDEECTFLVQKLWVPMTRRENVVISYGEPEGYDRPGFRFLKVMIKE